MGSFTMPWPAIPGVGTKRYEAMLARFGSLAEAWRATRSELKEAGLDQRGRQRPSSQCLSGQAQQDGVMLAFLATGLDHRRIHMGAPGIDLVQAGTGEQTAARARMARPQGFVIGIEQIGEARIERLARQIA